MCDAFQPAYTPTWRCVKRRTGDAQEIEAVNKGPSDKGSPDSYESQQNETLAHSTHVRSGMTKQIIATTTKASISFGLFQWLLPRSSYRIHLLPLLYYFNSSQTFDDTLG